MGLVLFQLPWMLLHPYPSWCCFPGPLPPPRFSSLAPAWSPAVLRSYFPFLGTVSAEQAGTGACGNFHLLPKRGMSPKFVPSFWQAEATWGIKAAVQQHPCVCPVSDCSVGWWLCPMGQVGGPGVCLSLTTLMGDGHSLYSMWPQLGAASPPTRLSLCSQHRAGFSLRSSSWSRLCLGLASDLAPLVQAGVRREPAVPTPWPWLRVSVWCHGPCPPVGCPAGAGCARRVPGRPGAPPAAAPGAGAPGRPAAPLPGAAGPAAPAGCPGRSGTALAQPQELSQPCLPTCSRCCLQACISWCWLCSTASRCPSAASRSRSAASRLRPSAVTSCCQRCVSHCGDRDKVRVSLLPWAAPGQQCLERRGCAHLPAVFLGWHGAGPELPLELPAVLSPLPLCPGQGALNLWVRARPAPPPCLGESRWARVAQEPVLAAQDWPCTGTPLTLSHPGRGCDALLGDGSSSSSCPALVTAWLSPPWLLLSPCPAVWGQRRRMSVTRGTEEGCSDGE